MSSIQKTYKEERKIKTSKFEEKKRKITIYLFSCDYCGYMMWSLHNTKFICPVCVDREKEWYPYMHIFAFDKVEIEKDTDIYEIYKKLEEYNIKSFNEAKLKSKT
jgi:RNA polymerase subunit RPABC4/transcription elongation factor Spt4